MKTFIWTDLALRDYHENIDYLIREWSEKEAIGFIEDVENTLFFFKIRQHRLQGE
jgi:plasmid stabilization system protein ParE